MRSIEQASSFKRDFKRVKASPHHSKDVDALLAGVLKQLVQDQALPDKNRDHSLVGNWSGYRECHLKSDLLLIYKMQGADVLRLARFGSHSELFG